MFLDRPLRTPSLYRSLLGLLVGGVVVGAAGQVSAELVVRDLDASVSDAEFTFDLNQDGEDDFVIIDSGGLSLIRALDGSGGQIVDVITDVFSVMDLYGPGDQVGADPTAELATEAYFYHPQGGPFSEEGDTGYVGLLIDHGETNFGWAQITRGSTIIGQVGYETTPGAPASIPVPEPGSIALGFAALAAAIAGGRRRS